MNSLGSKRTLNETLRQVLKLETIKLVVGSSTRLQKMSDKTLGLPCPEQKKKW
jgi:hypothetical protein